MEVEDEFEAAASKHPDEPTEVFEEQANASPAQSLQELPAGKDQDFVNPGLTFKRTRRWLFDQPSQMSPGVG